MIVKCAGKGQCTSAPTPIATGQSFPDSLVIDGANAYWTTSNGMTVARCPLGGCGAAPTILASGQSLAWAIAIDSSAVYWAGGGGTTADDWGYVRTTQK
jgi:hypothetical protein